MSQMKLYSEVSDFVKARREVINPGEFAEALAVTALEALNHLFADDGNTVRVGAKEYGLVNVLDRDPIESRGTRYEPPVDPQRPERRDGSSAGSMRGFYRSLIRKPRSEWGEHTEEILGMEADALEDMRNGE